MLRYEVRGNSMLPGLWDGQRLLVVPKLPFMRFRQGDLVLLSSYKKTIVKRLAKIEKDNFFVQGDNLAESTDSRHFGAVKKADIIGKVLLRY